MRAYKQLKAWEEIVISSDDEEELARQITVSSVSGPSTSKTRARTEQGVQGLVLESLAGERKNGLSVNSDEIWGHGNEIKKKEFLLLVYYTSYINQNGA